MKAEEYDFRIDAFTPDKIPLSRLAEYLAELAKLLGNHESVHFRRLKKGSTRVITAIEREAVPKVRMRLQGAADPDAPDDVRKPFRRINEMLREDNATGQFARNDEAQQDVLLRFVGREAFQQPRMGPFTEFMEIDGKIVRVGGKDKTAHVLIEDSEGRVWPVTVTKEFAVQLAPLIFNTPVRIGGNARWERNELGEWILLGFRAKEWRALEPDDLATAIGKLREIDAEWKSEEDPFALVENLREDPGEAH
jgi:hypothetical protein